MTFKNDLFLWTVHVHYKKFKQDKTDREDLKITQQLLA